MGAELILSPYVTLEEFMGGRVREIRVIYATTPGASNPNPASLQKQALEAWAALFNEASASLDWAEGEFWNLEAVVVCEDGRHGAFRTDGWHAEVRDLSGKHWFIRFSKPPQ
jgi:hypothetical protein